MLQLQPFQIGDKVKWDGLKCWPTKSRGRFARWLYFEGVIISINKKTAHVQIKRQGKKKMKFVKLERLSKVWN